MATIGKTIILFGLKSSFKSSHGQKLAKHFELPFYDTDYVIQKMAGMSPQEIYVNQGVSAFMQAEEAACRKLVEVTKDKNAIISTGGDICCNPPALNALRSKGDFYLLKTNPQASVDMIMKMVHEPQPGFFTNIPFYIVGKNPESLDEIAKLLLDTFSERLRTFEAIADKIIEIKNASQADDYNTILEAI